MSDAGGPTSVTVAIPTYNEEQHIETCLDAVLAQTYAGPMEVLVVDGRSTDATRSLAGARTGVRVLDNPNRVQAAALNIALREATGEVFVRVDGHAIIAPDYVERCVEALRGTGAAMVGGSMTPVATGWRQRGIAAAFTSPVGIGPARFHGAANPAGWTDTVYLGAFPTDVGRQAGGYSEAVGVNEDAEFAIRMADRGGIWFEPSVRSRYSPRPSFLALARQFHRYGRSRAATVRRHPRSLRPRQLAAPLLVLGLAGPRRRTVTTAYLVIVAAATGLAARKDLSATPGFVIALPVMHVCWGTGFLRGLISSPPVGGRPCTDAPSFSTQVPSSS